MRERVAAALRRRKADKGYLREFEKLQWLTPAETADYQFRVIKDLLRHAQATVPYYRDLLHRQGIAVEDISSRDDFAKIPLLTKSLIKSNRESLISTGTPLSSLIPNTSGGSTGEPVSFYQDDRLFRMMEANTRLGYRMAGWTGREPFFLFWGNPKEFLRKKNWLDRAKEQLTGRTIFNSYNYTEETIGGWVEAILRSKGVFLYGYTSVLADIARHVRQKGINISSVHGVITTAEKLYPWQRELMTNSFNARILDHYGSREVPGIACECREGNMHQLSHSAYLEFLDDPSAPDSRKVVATCLTNFAMPFIRYEIGDYARPKEGVCSCGRGFPLMEMDIGRTADSFVTPKGGTVYGTFFIRQMYGQDRVRSFQFHQVTPELINLYVVRSEGFGGADAERLGAIESTVRRHLDAEMRVVVTFVDEIPKTGGGKHRFIVSDLVRGQ